MSKDKNIKTTCNEIIAELVCPEPAAVVAALTGTSASYVKKVRTGDRNDTSIKAQKIKMCDQLICNEKTFLLATVSQMMHEQETSNS